MLLAQFLLTNAFYKQIETDKFNNCSTKDTIEMLKKIVNALQKEINNIKDTI